MQLKYLCVSTSFVLPCNKVSLACRVEKLHIVCDLLCKMLVEPVSDFVFAKIPQNVIRQGNVQLYLQHTIP